MAKNRKKYESGVRIRNFTLLERDYSKNFNKGKKYYWKCICDFGKEHIYDSIQFVRPGNCSCSRRGTKQIVAGLKYNRLTAIKLDHVVERVEGFKYYWLFECECGKQKIINVSCVKSGNTKSCGCLNKETARSNATRWVDSVNHIPDDVYMTRKLLSKYRYAAKSRGLQFSISDSTFAELIKQDCYYCGSNTERELRCTRGLVTTNLVGVDRIDSSQGYIDGNVLPCCKKCNIAKGVMTLLEFKEHINLIYNHLAKI